MYANLISDTEHKDKKIIKRNISKKPHEVQNKVFNLNKGEVKKNYVKPDVIIKNSNSMEKSRKKSPSKHSEGIENISFTTSYNKDCYGDKNKITGNNSNNKIRKVDLLTQNEKKLNKPKIQKITTESNNRKPIQREHRSRSAHCKLDVRESNKHDIESKSDNSEKSNLKETDIYLKKWKSSEKKSPIQVSTTNSERISDTESSVRRLSSAQSKQIERNIKKNVNTKIVNNSTPKRKEYVINYDDKNGTMSSMCKVKAGSNSSRRRKAPIDMNKNNCKENKYYSRK